MNFRYFLRGLGVGIVFAAIIFIIAYRTVPNDTLTDDEVIQRAKELGMVLEDNKVDELINDVSDKVSDKTTQDKSGETTESTENVTENTENVTAQTTEVLEEEIEHTDSTYKITVTPGSSSYQVCQQLQELGLIDDAARFDNYLIDHGYAGKIAVGTHTLKDGMLDEEIAVAISDK